MDGPNQIRWECIPCGPGTQSEIGNRKETCRSCDVWKYDADPNTHWRTAGCHSCPAGEILYQTTIFVQGMVAKSL